MTVPTVTEMTKTVADHGYSLGDLYAICLAYELESVDEAIKRVYQGLQYTLVLQELEERSYDVLIG